MPKDFTKKKSYDLCKCKKRLKKCKVGIFTWFLFSYLFCDLLVRKDHLIFFEGYRSTSHSRAHDKHLQIYTHTWYGMALLPLRHHQAKNTQEISIEEDGTKKWNLRLYLCFYLGFFC